MAAAAVMASCALATASLAVFEGFAGVETAPLFWLTMTSAPCLC